MLCDGDLVLLGDTMDGHIIEFCTWVDAFENTSLKVNLEKIKVMVSVGVTSYELSQSKVSPCWICGLIVANLDFCLGNVVSGCTVGV